MQVKKIDNDNLGGDLGKVTTNLMNSGAIASKYIPFNKSLLPSKGLFYTDDMYIKKMSSVDIKNLSTVNTDNVNGVMNGIIAHNIQGVQVNDILLGDKIWLIFYLRSITYNDYPYQIKYTCDECQKLGLFNMTLDSLTVSYLPEDTNFNIQLGEDKIEIGFPTIGNEVQCNQIKKQPENYSVEPIDEEILDLACNIKTINGSKVSIMKAYEYLVNMDGMDFTKFGNYLAKISFGVKPYIEITCKCGNVVKTPLQFTPEFFMPDVK